MPKQYVLCLDQGGSSSRAIIFDEQGAAVCSSQQEVDQRRHHEKVEQCPEQLVSSLKACALDVVKQLPPGEREQLVACGLTTQRSSLLAVNKVSGQPLSSVLSWQDTRGTSSCPTTGSALPRHTRTFK